MADNVNNNADNALNYGVWDLARLRKELKSRREKISGRKKELIERLEFFDRNKQKDEVLEEEYLMDIPSFDQYRDINSDTNFKILKIEAVEFYLEQLNKNINNEIKQIYNNRFLKYIRMANDSTRFFFKAECRAEMKKKVTYHLDISLDIHGCILECQCECAAGMGPTAHCKHVCTFLYALYRFSIFSEIITEETCTQRLQTFHQSKPFKGSPIKAKDLPLSGSKSDVIFEPRPRKYIKMTGYNDHFRNIWLSHPYVNSFPISQIFKPANSYAVNNDHDYLKEPLSDMWLKDNYVTHITQDQISLIEHSTRGQSANKNWLRLRSHRLNSSQFGKICKATVKTDLDKLAKSLTNPAQDIQAAPIIHGRKFEKVAIQEFVEKTQSQVEHCGTFVCENYPFLASSPDGLLNPNKVMEIKCPFSSKDQYINSDTVPYLKYDEEHQTYHLSETHDYYFQVQGQLLCTGRQDCIFIVYTFKDLKYITISRNDTFILNMVQKLDSFYNNYFKNALLEKFYYKDYRKYSF